MALTANFSPTPTIECGCDEAGRGCLAGPVCAAAVIFPYGYSNEEINDSKQLTEKKRNALREIILRDALAYAVTEISPADIDKMNILHASIHAMNLAISQLSIKPELILVDGNRFTDRWHIPYRCIVKGDATYLSIAAASILAKTHRDALMTRLADEFPDYDWKNNKGYPAPKHIAAVNKLGLTPYHRKSFHLKNQLSLDF